MFWGLHPVWCVSWIGEFPTISCTIIFCFSTPSQGVSQASQERSIKGDLCPRRLKLKEGPSWVEVTNFVTYIVLTVLFLKLRFGDENFLGVVVRFFYDSFLGFLMRTRSLGILSRTPSHLQDVPDTEAAVPGSRHQDVVGLADLDEVDGSAMNPPLSPFSRKTGKGLQWNCPNLYITATWEGRWTAGLHRCPSRRPAQSHWREAITIGCSKNNVLL